MKEGITQAEFAARLGVSQPRVAKFKYDGRLVLSKLDGRILADESIARINSTSHPAWNRKPMPGFKITGKLSWQLL